MESTRREVAQLLTETEEGRQKIRKTDATGEALFAETTPEGRTLIREMIQK